MSKVLFSPLGKTDPISNRRDGSMLHICRIYQPDKVYLYMSSEILKDHEMDNRYIYCLEQLGKKLRHKFKVCLIKRPELVDVHKLDDFYDEFNKCLQKIEAENEGDILLNVSSGTPAMKMTLQVLASIHPERYTEIQVGTPAKGANKEHEDTDHYDAAVQWECDLDNQPEEFEDRSSHSKTANLFLNIQKENIKRLVREYDYSAALSLAENMKDALSSKAVLYLQAAERRNLLDLSGVQKILGDTAAEILDTIEGDDKIVIEYLLNLDIKLRKKQYADYIRAITPVVLDIFLAYMKKNQHIVKEQFCVKRRKKAGEKNGVVKYKYVWYLSIQKMEKETPEILKILRNTYASLKENPLSSEYVSTIILAKEKDVEVRKAIDKIRDIEKDIRNYAAHEIVAITEESIQKDASVEPKEILKLLEMLAVKGGIKLKKEYWDSYDRMNERIIREINVQI